jgi:hypothetical protein
MDFWPPTALKGQWGKPFSEDLSFREWRSRREELNLLPYENAVQLEPQHSTFHTWMDGWRKGYSI